MTSSKFDFLACSVNTVHKFVRIIKIQPSLLLWLVGLVFYAIWSYGLTDPNLVLTSWQPYWQFQQYMWQTLYSNPPLLATLFVLILVLLFSSYLRLSYKLLSSKSKLLPLIGTLWGLSILILFVSYNGLSHDIFNYIFNAKMIVVYKQNPHLTTALSFAKIDDWVRFMHNTHTPAPYGYGWTALSLLPFIVGLQKFTLTWLIFRVFQVFSLVLLAKTLFKVSKNQALIWILLFNPLLLIEVVSNQHNDLWMMIPAIWALFIVSKKSSTNKKFLSLLLLIISISTKLASLALLPLWLMLVIKDFSFVQKTFGFKTISNLALEHWPFWASVLMFIPLLSPRSKLFLPWYLIWSLVWIPLFNTQNKLSWIKQVWAKTLILSSLFALTRYLPWLNQLNYEGSVSSSQLIVLWSGILLSAVFSIVTTKKSPSKN